MLQMLQYSLILLLLGLVLYCVVRFLRQDVTVKLPDMPSVLSEELKDQYRVQLKINPSKETGPEVERTMNLERLLVDAYGFDGIKLIFEGKNSGSLYQLGEFPQQCPWAYLNGTEVDVAIDTLFASIAGEIPNLVATLKDRCKYLYAERRGETWMLHYFLDMALYDGRSHFVIYSGGEPNENPMANASLVKYQWDVPNDLKRLYAIHDGLGPILGSGDISVMAQVMDPICEDQNFFPVGYQFADLLEFHPDGCGNAQCFLRQGDQYMTVDWDHETREISSEDSFFEYLDERLSQLDEE